jgi:hypothetical protein
MDLMAGSEVHDELRQPAMDDVVQGQTEFNMCTIRT